MYIHIEIEIETSCRMGKIVHILNKTCPLTNYTSVSVYIIIQISIYKLKLKDFACFPIYKYDYRNLNVEGKNYCFYSCNVINPRYVYI